MISHLARFTFSMLALVGFAGSAQAALQFAELTLDDCDLMGCEGSTLHLSVQEEASGSWLVKYTINTENYTGSLAGFNQIGFKAIDGWTSGTVLSSPVGSATDWNPVIESPIASNSLCEKTNGDTDKVCVAGFVNIQNALPDGTYDYTWTFNIEGGTLITDTSEWHLGGQYANGMYRTGPDGLLRSGTAGHIISAEGGTPPVPEPTAALLFGLGALLVTRSVRHR
jgi:hypothetical protein